jgi:hypothetical protein
MLTDRWGDRPVLLTGLLSTATVLAGMAWFVAPSTAGVFFIAQAHASVPPAIVKVAGYAGVGAIYFLVSALWLSAGPLRRKFASTH